MTATTDRLDTRTAWERTIAVKAGGYRAASRWATAEPPADEHYTGSARRCTCYAEGAVHLFMRTGDDFRAVCGVTPHWSSDIEHGYVDDVSCARCVAWIRKHRP